MMTILSDNCCLNVSQREICGMCSCNASASVAFFTRLAIDSPDSDADALLDALCSRCCSGYEAALMNYFCLKAVFQHCHDGWLGDVAMSHADCDADGHYYFKCL